MSDLIVIPADGEAYTKYAEVLLHSMRVWGWDMHASFVVLSATVEGKASKVGFREALGHHTGKVVLMDADMVAIGPYPFARYNCTTAVAINDTTVDSCLLLFPDAVTATKVSKAWERRYEELGRPKSDVAALNCALGTRPQTFNRSAQVYPAPSVYHYCGPKAAYYQERHAS
jgi:hypothetical protein